MFARNPSLYTLQMDSYASVMELTADVHRCRRSWSNPDLRGARKESVSIAVDMHDEAVTYRQAQGTSTDVAMSLCRTASNDERTLSIVFPGALYDVCPCLQEYTETWAREAVQT